MVNDDVTFDARDLRVTFLAGDDIWALKFGSPGAFERFLQKWAGPGAEGCRQGLWLGGRPTLAAAAPGPPAVLRGRANNRARGFLPVLQVQQGRI